MEPNLKFSIGVFTDADSGARSARIVATNIGDKPVEKIKIDFAYEFETPQVVSDEFRLGDGEIQEVGRSFGFVSPSGQDDEPLVVGSSRAYLLPPQWMNEMRSVVQSLSPERYSIRVTIDGKESTAIPGPHWGDFVQRKLDEPPSRARGEGDLLRDTLRE